MANHEKRRDTTPSKTEPAKVDVDAEIASMANSIAKQTDPMLREHVLDESIVKSAQLADGLRKGAIVDASPPRPRAILWSVKIRDGELIVGASSTTEVNPLDPGRPGWDVVVCGPSVLIVPPVGPVTCAPIRGSGGNGQSPAFAELATAHSMPAGAEKSHRIAHEVPRSACVIRWLVPADATAEQFGEMVFGRSFSAPTAAPDGAVVLARRERARVAADRKATAAKPAAPRADYIDDDKDDGLMGSGPAGEA